MILHITFTLLILTAIRAYIDVSHLGLEGYGCWCNFNENYAIGRGQPVDEVDQLCMEY